MGKDKKELFRETEARLRNYKYLDTKIKNLVLDIESEKNNYKGYSAISYEERTGATYNISRSVENEIIEKDKTAENIQRLKDEFAKRVDKKFKL